MTSKYDFIASNHKKHSFRDIIGWATTFFENFIGLLSVFSGYANMRL